MTHHTSTLPSDTYSGPLPHNDAADSPDECPRCIADKAVEAAREFTDSEGETFSTEARSFADQSTVALTVTTDGGRTSIEFFASDAGRIIDLIRAAAK